MPNDILTGKIQIRDSSGSTVMTWNAETGQASIGGGWSSKSGPHGHSGSLTANNNSGETRVQIGSDATITVGAPEKGGIISDARFIARQTYCS